MNSEYHRPSRVLVIRGQRGRLSGWITNPDPAYGREGFGVALEKFPNTIQESRPVEGHENDPKAIEAAKLLNESTQKAFQVLQEAQTNKKAPRKARCLAMP